MHTNQSLSTLTVAELEAQVQKEYRTCMDTCAHRVKTCCVYFFRLICAGIAIICTPCAAAAVHYQETGGRIAFKVLFGCWLAGEAALVAVLAAGLVAFHGIRGCVRGCAKRRIRKRIMQNLSAAEARGRGL